MHTWLDRTDFGCYGLIPEELLPGWEGTEADDVIQEKATHASPEPRHRPGIG
ncbi:hypothetical protein [Streptomyces sp. NPDC054887]